MFFLLFNPANLSPDKGGFLLLLDAPSIDTDSPTDIYIWTRDHLHQSIGKDTKRAGATG